MQVAFFEESCFEFYSIRFNPVFGDFKRFRDGFEKNGSNIFLKTPNQAKKRPFKETTETLEIVKVSIVLPPLWKNPTWLERKY